eukprot:3549186-Rhodomonas_salina.2
MVSLPPLMAAHCHEMRAQPPPTATTARTASINDSIASINGSIAAQNGIIASISRCHVAINGTVDAVVGSRGSINGIAPSLAELICDVLDPVPQLIWLVAPYAGSVQDIAWHVRRLEARSVPDIA